MVRGLWVIIFVCLVSKAVTWPIPSSSLHESMFDMCAEADIYQIEELRKNLSENQFFFENQDKRLISFGLLEEDWERLRLLENRIPVDSVLKKKVLRMFRILIAALYQAHGSSVEDEIQPESNEESRVLSKETTEGQENLTFRESGNARTVLHSTDESKDQDNKLFIPKMNETYVSKESANSNQKVKESSITQSIVLKPNRTEVTVPTLLKGSSETVFIIQVDNEFVIKGTKEKESDAEESMDYILFPSTLDYPSFHKYFVKPNEKYDKTSKPVSSLSTRVGKYYLSSTNYSPTTTNVEDNKNPSTTTTSKLEQIHSFVTKVHSPKTGYNDTNSKEPSSSSTTNAIIYDSDAELTRDPFYNSLDGNIEGMKENGPPTKTTKTTKYLNFPTLPKVSNIPGSFKTSSNIKLVYSIEITTTKSWENSAKLDDKIGCDSVNKDEYFPIVSNGNSFQNIKNSNESEITLQSESKPTTAEPTHDNYPLIKNVSTRTPFDIYEIITLQPNTVQNNYKIPSATDTSTLKTTESVISIEPLDHNETEQGSDQFPNNIVPLSTETSTSNNHNTLTSRLLTLDGNGNVTTNKPERENAIISNVNDTYNEGEQNIDEVDKSGGSISSVEVEMDSNNLNPVYLRNDETNATLHLPSSTEFTSNQNQETTKNAKCFPSTESSSEEKVEAEDLKKAFKDNVSFEQTTELTGNKSQDQSSNEISKFEASTEGDLEKDPSIEIDLKCPTNGNTNAGSLSNYFAGKPNNIDFIKTEEQRNSISKPQESFRTYSINLPNMLKEPPPTQVYKELKIFPAYESQDTLSSPVFRKACGNRNDCVMVKNIVYKSHKAPLMVSQDTVFDLNSRPRENIDSEDTSQKTYPQTLRLHLR